MNDTMYDRVRVLVPAETRDLKALICGAGMVGSWTAAALVRMLSQVTVLDYDVVNTVNLGVQMYSPHDIEDFKVFALERVHSGYKNLIVERESQEDFLTSKDISAYDVVVSATDSMAAREWLAKRCRQSFVPLFVDVRVMGEMVCILTAQTRRDSVEMDTDSYDDYLMTIQPDDEVEEATCGAEGTVYSGMFAAQRVASTVNNWKRRLTVRPKEVWNVALMEHLDKEDK